MTKFDTNASGTIWWPNFELIGFTCICYKMGHLFQLTIGSPSGTTYIGTRLSHFHCHITLDCHIISWYWVGCLISLSHIINFQQPLSVTDRQTENPTQRSDPRTPGSDKNDFKTWKIRQSDAWVKNASDKLDQFKVYLFFWLPTPSLRLVALKQSTE